MSFDELVAALNLYRAKQLADPGAYVDDDGAPDPDYGARVAGELMACLDEIEAAEESVAA